MRKSTAARTGLVLFSLVIITAGILWLGLALDLLYAWLAAINIITFLTYGYDKWVAGSSMTRIPEIILLVLALLGGTIGALLGMYIFRHKTSKSEFKNKLFLVLVLQVLIIAVYYFFF